MNVIWAPQAKKDFRNNIDYLEAEWSEKSVLHFIEKVNTTITLLKNDNVFFLKQTTEMFTKLSLPNIYHSFTESKTTILNY